MLPEMMTIHLFQATHFEKSCVRLRFVSVPAPNAADMTPLSSEITRKMIYSRHFSERDVSPTEVNTEPT
jgi:hypothetical protein